MAESFARMKWRWLDRAMHDGRLSPRARCVAYEIGRHINAVTGEAWPSQETMRRNLSFKHVNQVKKAVAELLAAGHLVVSRDDRTRSNTYVPKFEAALHVVAEPSRKAKRGTRGGPTSSAKDGTTRGPILRAHDRTTGGPTWDQNAKIDGTTGGPLSSKDNTQTEKMVVLQGGLSNSDAAAWQSVMNNLARTLSPSVAAGWFGKVTVDEVSELELVLNAPTRFAAQWINNHFAEGLLTAARVSFPSIQKVTVNPPSPLRERGGAA